jgi:hypothetical protein
VPGKAWFVGFRFYAPLEPYFDKAWPLPDIEKVKRKVGAQFEREPQPAWQKSPLFELARVFVRFDHVASRIVNANHCIM